MIWPLMIAAIAVAAPVAKPLQGNGYPTEVSADYVLGCMAANGQTQDMLRRCACSIDTIAAVVPFETYEQAETILRMRQATGQAASLFRETPALKDVVDRLRAAHVEADFRCF